MPAPKDPEKRKLWIKRLSEALTGIHPNKEIRKRISEAKKGKKRAPFSDEWKRKISEANKGKRAWNKNLTKETDERVRKMSETKKGQLPWNTNKHWSGKIREKISKSHKGKGHPCSLETREKISKGNKGKKKPKTDEQRKKISERMKGRFAGEKNPMFKDGSSETYRNHRAERRWLEIAKKIRKRDNYTCQHCGNPGYDVHHIIPWRLTHNDNPSNLVTLCRSCHSLIENNTQFNKRLAKI